MTKKGINKGKVGRIALVAVGPLLLIVFITVDACLKTISDSFEWIAKIPDLFYIIVGVCAFWGILHLILVPKDGIAAQHLLFKRLGPIISAPSTGVTHGIFIYCGVQLIYLFCYDSQTMVRYQGLDKASMTITMLAIMTYSVYGLSLIIVDIVNSNNKKEETGKIVESPVNSADENG